MKYENKTVIGCKCATIKRIQLKAHYTSITPFLVYFFLVEIFFFALLDFFRIG